MEERGSRNPQEVPDEALHPVLHDEVLPTEDVGDAELHIVHRPRELEQRPDTVLVPHPRVVEVADAEEDPVAKRGVGIVEVGP